MRILTAIFLVTSSRVFAHDSLVPHHHPHGASALPDVVTLVGAGFLLAGVWFVARRYFKD